MKNKKIYFLIVPLVLIVAAAAFYFLYFTKTPAYTFEAVRRAVKNHDTETFSRYVDTNSVINYAFDDILAAESQVNHSDIFNNPFAMAVLKTLKPSVVKILEKEALKKIADPGDGKDKDKNKNPETTDNYDPVPDAMRRNIDSKVGLEDLKIKDAKVTQDGEDALITLILHNDKLDKDFIAELQLARASNNVWRVIRVKNLKQFVIELENARRAQKVAENAPVQERMNKALTIKESSWEIKDTPNAQNADEAKSLNTHLTVQNNSGKTIKRAAYDVALKGGKSNLNYSFSLIFNNKIEPGQTLQLNNTKQLHNLIESDKQLIAAHPDGIEMTITPTHFSFTDGTVLEPSNYIEE